MSAGSESLTRARKYWVMTALTCFWVLAAGLTLFTVCRGPWLGISVLPDDSGGIVVTHVDARGPSSGLLEPGDVVLALSAPGLPQLALEGRDFPPVPYYINTYSALDGFLARQEQAFRRLHQDSVDLILSDRRVVRIHPAPARPWSTLPSLVAIQLLFAAVTIAISAIVLSQRFYDPAARYLASTAAGYTLIVSGEAVYASRELVLPSAIFHASFSLQCSAGLVMVAGCMAALLWHYPASLSPLRFPRWLLGGCVGVALLNELRWFESMTLAVDTPLYAMFGVMIVLAVAQWRRASNRAAHRAMLKWLFIPWFLGLSFYYFLVLAPMSLGGDPIVSHTLTWAFVPFIFLGLALGLTRFRLFYLNPANIRAWMLSGMLLLLTAMGGIWLFQWQPYYATCFALLISGFAFHPLARMLAARQGLEHALLQQVLPTMLERALKASNAEQADAECRVALEELFRPGEVRTLHRGSVAGVMDDGETLITPALPSGEVLALRLPFAGRSLFTSDDAQVAENLCDLFARIANYWREHERGSHNERLRIARRMDLDLGTALTALCTESSAPALNECAQSSVAAFRSVMSAFCGEMSRMDECLNSVRAELASRCSDAGMTLDSSFEASSAELDPQGILSLRRILREAATNAIRHSGGSRIRLIASFEQSHGMVSLEDDGNGRVEPLVPGNGLQSMKRRAESLGWTLSVQQAALGGLRICLRFAVTPRSSRTSAGSTFFGNALHQ